jgi:uncharacterized protein YjbJ (UPF0337 family)
MSAVALYAKVELVFNRSIVISREGDTVKSSIKDKIEGTFHEVKGAVREMAGKITDNPKLKMKGKAEKIAGKAQEKLGDVKKVFGK